MFKVGDIVRLKKSNYNSSFEYWFRRCEAPIESILTIKTISSDRECILTFVELNDGIGESRFSPGFYGMFFELVFNTKISQGYNRCYCGSITKNTKCCGCK